MVAGLIGTGLQVTYAEKIMRLYNQNCHIEKMFSKIYVPISSASSLY